MVDATRIAVDDFVQLRERLDLVGDETAHRGCAFARFVRQFEHAALQFLARLVEGMLHFVGDFAQFAEASAKRWFMSRKSVFTSVVALS